MLTKIWTGTLLFLAWLSFCAWLVLVCREKNVHPLRDFAAFFKKQTTVGRILFGTFFLIIWVYASVKPEGEGNGEQGTGNGGGTNSVQQMAAGNVANVGMLPISITNSNVSVTASHLGQLVNGNIGTGNTSTMATIITSTNTTHTIEAADFERGFVQTRIGTDEQFDFSPITNATIVSDWRAFGAATDWIYASVKWKMESVKWGTGNGEQGTGNGEQGTDDETKLRIHSDGWLEVKNGATFYPLRTILGIVPEANWPQILHFTLYTLHSSQVWYAITPENSLVITWQNALLDRDTDKPLSFQIEFKTNGQFTYRYDLSRLGDTGGTGVSPVGGISIGASFGGNAWSTNSLPTNITSMAFYPLTEEDAYNQDPDNDGLLTIDELFFYDTDPRNPDTDYDGLTDYEELFIYNTNPLNPHSVSDAYCDGIAVKIGDVNPFSYPEGSTNTVLEHVFYSGTTNGVFAYPTSTVETAVLKIMVSGSGTGRLVVGDAVVPLIAQPPLRSGAQTNMLLLAVGKGVRKEVWFDKPEGLDVAIDSADFLIGEMPTWYRVHGWLAFPHTDATVPCIHDFYAKGRMVTLVHGVEFPGLTAEWTSEESGVAITNVPPVSAAIYGSFPKSATRTISYTLNHPNQLNSTAATFTQTLRFCPQLEDDDEPTGGSGGGGDEEPEYWNCECGWNGSCSCCAGEWCHCSSWDCPCNNNQSPTLDDNDDEEEEAYTNIVNGVLSPLSDVLYLYRSNSRTENLPVPGGPPKKCCPCPEHWASNYVAKVSYSSRVAVKDAAGNDFNIAYEPCTVTVSGVTPSREFGDSTINFVTNGASYKRTDYTVLGVKFESNYNRPPLLEYNQRSPSFGYPITVCTNINEAATIVLRTDVCLTNGVIRLSMLNVTGSFQVWLPEWWDNNSNYHAPEILLASAGRTERYFSIRQWYGIMQRYGWYNGRRTLAVKVLSSSQGHCDLKFEYVSSCGAGYVHDHAQQRITSVNPPLLPDYNRDGKIGIDDVARYLLHSAFRYWINECKVTGDVWEEPSLFQGIADALVGLDNWRNNHVDGKYDLVNLFPVAISAEPFLDAWGGSGNVNVKIRCLDGDDVFRFTLADVGHADAGSIRIAPCFSIAGQPMHSSTMNWLTNSLTISSGQYNANFDRNSALLVCEAAKPTWLGLLLTVEVDGSAMYSFRLPMSMSTVDDMYRYVSIRDAFENEMTSFSGTNAPQNNPDSELGNKDVFFVHGFNVSPENARNWNREMFKRFWVSGMNARYWGVTWSGDYHVLFEDFNGLHYHRDVRQALMTAPTFRNLVNSNGVDSVVIGHSLGNMVVSEALLANMNAKTYIMLDAAVASEAYRPELQANSTELIDKYVPSDWDGYHERTWAANWYTWFTNDVNDARGKIGWAGHFAPLLNKQGLDVYNFYSSGDEVFKENQEVPGLVSGVFHWPTLNLDWPFFHPNLELDAFPWQKQEVFKGVNAAGSLSAGWGFHCWTTNMNNETVWVKYSAAGANAMVMDGSIVTNAVFDRGVSAMFSPTISDYDKADILAFHIPAVSSPAGKVETVGDEPQDGLDFNLNDSLFHANGWGREAVLVTDEKGQHFETPWLHSDIKNMAYYYVYPAFTNIVEIGDLR